MLILSVGNLRVLVFFGRRETGRAQPHGPSGFLDTCSGKIATAFYVHVQVLSVHEQHIHARFRPAATGCAEPFWCNSVEVPRKSAEKRQ